MLSHSSSTRIQQTATPRSSSTSSICRSICRPAASTARPAQLKLHACTVPGLLHHQHQGDSSRRHHRSTTAAAAATAQDASASDDPSQQHQDPTAAAAADVGQQAQQHLDELVADDNIILLLGSEDEEEAEEDLKAGQEAEDEEAASGGVRVPEDFAAAMAAARQQLLSSSSGSSSEDDWDGGGGEPWDSTYSDSEDFWSTEKERVFLVGATYKQQYQQQQQRQAQQQRAARSDSSGGGAGRPRSLFDLSGSSRSSSSSRAGGVTSSGGLSPAAAAAVAAAGELADGGSSSSSGRRQRGGDQVSYSVDESLEELGRLAETAGLQVVGSTYQVLESPNPATYIGSGKVAEVAAAVQAAKADTVVFDDELSPGQLRNLEKAFTGGQGSRQVAVADRTALILDIFSQRARTREGKLQVDLAQTEYQLPRLTRMWTHLDRVAGGGQVKGVGEKQIEIDKRLLRDKAAALRRELEAVRTHRAAHRSRRQDAPIPVAALVGYTNAGKSTLLNTLTAAGVLAEDKLFATLDPTTRKVRLEGNLEVLFSDTVGFIQKLPTQLVASFRATLEEIAAASVVVHVLDISAPNAAAQCSAVLQVLDEIGVQDLPMITAWNKVDACANPAAVRALAASRPDVVAVSGATGEGLQELLELVTLKLAENMVDMQVLLPYSQGALLDELHKMGKVLDTAYTEAGTLLSASVPRCLVGKLVQYAAADSSSSIGGSSSGRNGGSSGWGGSSGSAKLGGQGDGDGCEGEEEEGLEGVQLIEEGVEGRQGSGLVLSGSSSSSMSSM